SSTTSALGTSAAASACQAVRKPSTAGGLASRSERYGSGAMPIPPPTSSGRSTSSRKPLPSGPRIRSVSPAAREHNALVPGPIGSIRKPSSLDVARQRLIGRGKSRPGTSSMKNWPGIPGSSLPRSTRSSVYGPTTSLPATLSALRVSTDSLLEAERDLVLRVGDCLDGGRRAGDRRHAGDAGQECRLADQVAVRARARALRRVDDEVAAPAADEVDHARVLAVLGHLADVLHGQSRGGQRVRRAGGCDQLEAERVQRTRDGDDGGLVLVADGEERRALGRQAAAGGALRLGKGGRQVGGAGHHLAGRAHLRAEHRVRAGEAREREHRGLDGDLSL